MNTKNIFRTLLMAILLLVGANSAKADKILYDNPSGSDNYAYITLPYGTFDNCEGEILRITYAIIPPNTPCTIQIGNVKTVTVTESGIYEMTLDNNFYANINTTNPYNPSIYFQPGNVAIYKIEIVSAGPKYTLTIDIDGTTTTQQVAEGADLLSILPTPTKSGYIFTGWDGLPANGLMPAEALTVTAQFVERAYVPATINSSTGYATFCSTEPLDFSGVTTVTAYYAAAVSDTEVTFKQIRGTVAAGTGLLLKGETSQIPVAETGTPASYPGNLLVGVTTDYDRVSGANLYVLVERNGKPVFAETAATPATVPAGKAYLSVLSSSNSRILTFSFAGEATSISAVETTLTGNEVIYNLRGQRVVNPGKGVYIINGKKVVLK